MFTEADRRITALIERSGHPVMVCRGENKYSFAARMAQFDKQARQTAEETHSPKDECTISIMGEEIVRLDEQVRDMANTIDRLEAALHNVILDRDQLLDDLHRSENSTGNCDFCKHFASNADRCQACDVHENDMWEWRGVEPKKEDVHVAT